jgi:nitrogen regulatory protein PII
MDQQKTAAARCFNDDDHVLVVTIVDSNLVEEALKAAQVYGDEGCSVIHGRGKYVGKNESVFNMPLDASRDLVLTVVRKERAGAVQDNIFEAVGLKTPGHGLVYQLPVSYLAGIACPGGGKGGDEGRAAPPADEGGVG